MERSEVLEVLEKLGLNEYESRVYTSLVLLGPSKASEISNESEVPQSKIYDILEGLMNKQLVEVFEGRPKEFKAVGPEIAFRNFLEKEEKQLKELKLRMDSISSSLKPRREEITGGIWSIKGRKWAEFFNKTSEMLDRSEKYAYGVTRDYSLSAKLIEAVKACVRKGVKVKVIGMEIPNEVSYNRVKWYKDAGVEVRVFETKLHPRIVLIDGKEVLLRLDHDPTKRNRFGFNSIWSDDTSLVKVIDTYIKNLWKKAVPINLKKISSKL